MVDDPHLSDDRVSWYVGEWDYLSPEQYDILLEDHQKNSCLLTEKNRMLTEPAKLLKYVLQARADAEIDPERE